MLKRSFQYSLCLLMVSYSHHALSCMSDQFDISKIERSNFDAGKVYSGNSEMKPSLALTGKVGSGKEFKLYLDDDLGEALISTIAMNPYYGARLQNAEVSKEEQASLEASQKKLEGHVKNEAKLKYLSALMGRLCSTDDVFKELHSEGENKSKDCATHYSYTSLKEFKDSDFNNKLSEVLGSYVNKKLEGSSYSWPMGAPNTTSPTCLLSSGSVSQDETTKNYKTKSCKIAGKEFNYTTWNTGDVKYCYVKNNMYNGLIKTASLGSSGVRSVGPSYPDPTADCNAEELALSGAVADSCIVSLKTSGVIDFWEDMIGGVKKGAGNKEKDATKL